jgi:hypothetical protein
MRYPKLMHPGALDTTSDEDLAAAFRYAADQVSALGQRFGFSVRGYDDPSLPHFCSLPLASRRQAVHALRGYHASLLAGIHADKNLDQPHISTWWAFSTLGLVPSADLFRHFQPDSMIEVYNLEGGQIWRNFQFFRYSSYTLEELHCLHWEKLYERGDEITAKCFAYISQIVGGGPELLLPPDPEYVLTEKCSRDRCVLKVRHYLLSALRNRCGEVAAYIVCTHGKVLAHGAREVPAGPREGGLRARLSLVPPPTPEELS